MERKNNVQIAYRIIAKIKESPYCHLKQFCNETGFDQKKIAAWQRGETPEKADIDVICERLNIKYEDIGYCTLNRTQPVTLNNEQFVEAIKTPAGDGLVCDVPKALKKNVEDKIELAFSKPQSEIIDNVREREAGKVETDEGETQMDMILEESEELKETKATTKRTRKKTAKTESAYTISDAKEELLCITTALTELKQKLDSVSTVDAKYAKIMELVKNVSDDKLDALVSVLQTWQK